MHLGALPHRRQTRPRDPQLVTHARHKALRELFGQGLAGFTAEQGHGKRSDKKCAVRRGNTVFKMISQTVPILYSFRHYIQRHDLLRTQRPVGAGHREQLHARAQHHTVDRHGRQPRPAPGHALCVRGARWLGHFVHPLRHGLGRFGGGLSPLAMGHRDTGHGVFALAGLAFVAQRQLAAGRQRQTASRVCAGRGSAIPQHQGLDAGARHRGRLGGRARRCHGPHAGAAAHHGGLWFFQQPDLRGGRLDAAALAGARSPLADVQPLHVGGAGGHGFVDFERHAAKRRLTAPSLTRRKDLFRR